MTAKAAAALLTLFASAGAVACGGTDGDPDIGAAPALGASQAESDATQASAPTQPASDSPPSARSVSVQAASAEAAAGVPTVPGAVSVLSSAPERLTQGPEQARPGDAPWGSTVAKVAPGAVLADGADDIANPQERVLVVLAGDETLVVPESPEAGDSAQVSVEASGGLQPSEGQQLSWFDGDVEVPVWTDTRLVVLSAPDGVDAGAVVASHGAQVVVDSSADPAAKAAGTPVFWSASGEMMTLPGGIVLMLDPSWDASAVDAFMTANGLDSAARRPLGSLTNAYAVAAGPGVASLHLANALAGLDGVVVSSPDWSIAITPK